MLEWIVEYWLQIGFGLIVAFITYLWKTFRSSVKDNLDTQNVVKEGISVLLWQAIYTAYVKSIHEGYISIDGLKIVESMYQQYHRLGGNGVGTRMYEELCKLPNEKPIINEVKDDKE